MDKLNMNVFFQFVVSTNTMKAHPEKMRQEYLQGLHRQIVINVKTVEVFMAVVTALITVIGATGKKNMNASHDKFTTSSNESNKINKGVLGPHEGIEYELMAKGKKDLALFSDLVPIEFIINPLSLSLKYKIAPENSGVIFYIGGDEKKATRLFQILEESLTIFDEDNERKIGHLLGYSETDITFYLNHWHDSSIHQEREESTDKLSNDS